MKATIFLLLLLAGCATTGRPTIEICAMQILQQVAPNVFVARQHCEADGEAT